MRTDDPIPPSSTLTRLRTQLARVRRRFAAQTLATRWSLGVLALAILIGIVYSATGSSTVTSASFIRPPSGKPFSSDELFKISAALNAKNVRYQIDPQNRIEILDADRVSEANEIVAKLNVGPQAISDIRKSMELGPWDTPWAAEQRQSQARSAILESMIRQIPGVVSAFVVIHRPKTRAGLRRVTPAAAFVFLETDHDRVLPDSTIASISTLIAGAEFDIKPGFVTILDRTGHQYLNALNPSLGVQSRTRVHEDELQQRILQELNWLTGVQVSVHLTPSQVIPMPQVPPPAELPPLPATANQPTPGAEADDIEVHLPSLSVGVNEPLELPVEKPSPAPVKPASKPAPRAATSTIAHDQPPSIPTTDSALENAKAKIWVKVPRSYFLRTLKSREPSHEVLSPFVERTKENIKTCIKHIVPTGQLEELDVSTIPDELPEPVPTIAQASADSRIALPWGIPASIAAGATAALLLIGFGVFSRRRPVHRSSFRDRDEHRHFKIDEASAGGPGPAERVRELIRLNPEAAASVLQRWTGQGGPLG